jgi:arylsulfatase A-like enzyme
VGVAGLEVSEGRLTGRTTTDFPIIHVERGSSAPNDVDGADLLHAIELRLRVSAGNNLQVLLRPSEEPDFATLLDAATRSPWALSTPLIPGDDVRTYTISVLGSAVVGGTDLSSAAIRRVLIRPSDSEGARFEIESVRLIFRQEYLATIPSGVSWQGFESVYKESLVTRAPETVRYEMTLPSRPWLDLSLATVEETPLTFRVSVEQGERETKVLERTLTTAHRWEPASLDLTPFADERVTLRLALSSDKPGALGFWGAPVVRSRDIASARSNEAPQAVILFVADTLRRDHLDAYGYARETAPTVTRLAREGALFEDAQTQAPWTRPAVSSILTSLYPTTHGVKATADRMPAHADTLAEVYRDAGYATFAITYNGFIGRGSNLHQGFEEFHESGALNRPAGQSASKTARVVVDRFLPWMRAHSAVPFFAYVHVGDPHSRFEPYRPYDTLWAQPNGKTEHEGRLARLRESIKGFRDVGNTGQPTREELEANGIDAARFVQHEKDWYDGSIRGMDAEIHRILEAIEELGLGSKTLFAFIGDHGEEFLEHDGHFHLNVYGENANVPLVLWAPGRIPAGTAVSETVRSIDLMPTLLELSGLETPEAAQGQSLVPLLSSGTAPSRWKARPAVTENSQRGAPADRPGLESFAIVDGGWKLVHNEVQPQGAPEWQLFDHTRDPLDQVDVSSQHPEIVERLKALLDDWHRYAEAARLPSDADATEGMSSEELERLRSLGYVR